MRVVVVGGGVLGLCCAQALAAEGAEVTVIEASTCGGAALASAGWVVPSLSSPRSAPGAPLRLARAAVMRRPGPRLRPDADPHLAAWLWRGLRACTPAVHVAGRRAMLALADDAVARFAALREGGVRFELHTEGLLAVALSEAPIDDLIAEAERLAELGYAPGFTRLSGGEARQLEPAVSDAVRAAVLLRGEAHVVPSDLIAGLIEHLLRRGVDIRGQTRVQRLRRDGDDWTVGAGRQEFRADAVVVAAGAASAPLLARCGVRIALTGARGASLTVAPAGVAPRHPLKLVEAMVACSPANGAVRLSGGYEIGARRATVDARRTAAVGAAAAPYLRDLRLEAATGIRAGVRPVTPDDLPVLGAVGPLPGLYVATGHGTLGLTTAPASAARLAAVVLHGREDPVLQPFRVERPALVGTRAATAAG